VTGSELAALDAITSAKLAWSPIADLKAAGHSVNTMLDLFELGMAEPWEVQGEGTHWTLTGLAAQSLGVRIEERLERHGKEWVEVPHWVLAGVPFRPIRIAPDRKRAAGFVIEEWADTAPRPDEDVEYDPRFRELWEQYAEAHIIRKKAARARAGAKKSKGKKRKTAKVTPLRKAKVKAGITPAEAYGNMPEEDVA
jgi:hypothetical protein